MSKRRAFGQVRKLPSGRWQARYRRDGRVVVGPDTFPTNLAARTWLDREAERLAAGAAADSDEIPTFEAYTALWRAGRTHMAPKTQATDAWAVKHLCGAFGGQRLDEVTPSAVRRWRADAAGRFGQASVAKQYRVLRAIFATAADDGLVAQSPVRIRGGGTEQPPPIRVATPEQVDALANAVPARYRALVLLGAWGTLRWSEAIGLRVRDWDPATRTVTVHEPLVETDGRFDRRRPKSAAGRRKVRLPDVAADALTAHIAQWVRPGDPEALMFTGSHGGVLRRSNWSRRTWAPAVLAAGLPAGWRFHELRHTGNTWAAQIPGVSTRDLMDRMGHATHAAALRYQHHGRDADTRIADGLSEVARRTQGTREGHDGSLRNDPDGESPA
jgi:integrase